MAEEGGSVTLVFYKVGNGIELLKEPFLNLVAAAFQMSNFTHVEISIGKTQAYFAHIFGVQNRACALTLQVTTQEAWARCATCAGSSTTTLGYALKCTRLPFRVSYGPLPFLVFRSS